MWPTCRSERPRENRTPASVLWLQCIIFPCSSQPRSFLRGHNQHLLDSLKRCPALQGSKVLRAFYAGIYIVSHCIIQAILVDACILESDVPSDELTQNRLIQQCMRVKTIQAATTRQHDGTSCMHILHKQFQHLGFPSKSLAAPILVRNWVEMVHKLTEFVKECILFFWLAEINLLKIQDVYFKPTHQSNVSKRTDAHSNVQILFMPLRLGISFKHTPWTSKHLCTDVSVQQIYVRIGLFHGKSFWDLSG